jgi:hypothetical protein
MSLREHRNKPLEPKKKEEAAKDFQLARALDLIRGLYIFGKK